MRRLLMIACAVVALSHVASAQTLRIVLREDTDIVDPTLTRTYVGRIEFAGLCDKLFDIDEKLNIVPQLAAGYEWADPKTLVIHLRPNVTFQNLALSHRTAVQRIVIFLVGTKRRAGQGYAGKHAARP